MFITHIIIIIIIIIIIKSPRASRRIRPISLTHMRDFKALWCYDCFLKNILDQGAQKCNYKIHNPSCIQTIQSEGVDGLLVSD